MTDLQWKQESRKFKAWKHRVAKSLTPYIIAFFSQANYSSDEARKLGRIINNINDPFFDILDQDRKRLSDTDVIGMRILLEIEVEEFYKKMRNNLRNQI